MRLYEQGIKVHWKERCYVFSITGMHRGEPETGLEVFGLEWKRRHESFALLQHCVALRSFILPSRIAIRLSAYLIKIYVMKDHDNSSIMLIG